MTPQEFMAKWGPGGPAYYLKEEQGAQSHFLDLCEVLGVPKPGTKADYLFEEVGDVIGGRAMPMSLCEITSRGRTRRRGKVSTQLSSNWTRKSCDGSSRLT